MKCSGQNNPEYRLSLQEPNLHTGWGCRLPSDLCYNKRDMITWLLLIPAATLFMAINVILGCYLFVRLGYGPPDWKTTLNLVVRVVVFQDRLNQGRDWLEKKAPWTDTFLDRLCVPKPIIIVEIPAVKPSVGEIPADEIPEHEELDTFMDTEAVNSGTFIEGGKHFPEKVVEQVLTDAEPQKSPI